MMKNKDFLTELSELFKKHNLSTNEGLDSLVEFLAASVIYLSNNPIWHLSEILIALGNLTQQIDVIKNGNTEKS